VILAVVVNVVHVGMDLPEVVGVNAINRSLWGGVVL
jgi:hypothetical protein